jgi:hypothetical protein
MTYEQDAHIRNIARQIVRDEINSTLIWDRINKMFSDLTMTTKIEEITRDTANRLVPQIVESRIDMATAGALNRLFPSFINSHPMMSSAMKTHLENVGQQVHVETATAINRLVNDRTYDFIGQNFREKLASDNVKKINEQLSVLKRKEEELNRNLSGLTTWKTMTTFSMMSSVGILMFMVWKQ